MIKENITAKFILQNVITLSNTLIVNSTICMMIMFIINGDNISCH